MYVCMYVCVCVYIYIYTHTHITQHTIQTVVLLRHPHKHPPTTARLIVYKTTAERTEAYKYVISFGRGL